MHTSKILAMGFPLILAGCSDFFGEDSGSFYTPPPPLASPTSPATGSTSITPNPTTSEGCGCPQPAMPSSAVPQPACMPEVDDPAWFPSEGQLVRAGDQVMDLKRSKNGVYPSHEEMARHLVVNMPVTAAQAEKILEELGL